MTDPEFVSVSIVDFMGRPIYINFKMIYKDIIFIFNRYI